MPPLFDLIEPFRPWADELLLRMLLDEQLATDAVQARADGSVWVTKMGKQPLIPAFNAWMQRHPVRFRGRDASKVALTRAIVSWASGPVNCWSNHPLTRYSPDLSDLL